MISDDLFPSRSRGWLLCGLKVATPDMAYVVCTERREGMDLNGQPITINVRATTIFRKQEGHWFVVQNHTDHR